MCSSAAAWPAAVTQFAGGPGYVRRLHGLLASACAMATWFRDAYASWQKGAVENANGRLRRDLPRDLDLDALGDAELQEIVLTHDLTPRKCLGFLTPLQALLGELGRDVRIRFA